MFTGLVQGVARIVDARPIAAGGGIRLTVSADGVPGFRAVVGDSIAINGACMTVTQVDGTQFSCDVSRESLACTVGLDRPCEVNLESALRLGDALGGHFVAGHVDGVAEVVRMTPHGESWELVVRASVELGPLIATKGSVTVNGVSLTVNRVLDTPDGCEFSINIIPHTYAGTNLRLLGAGTRVNLEVDLMARHLQRLLETSGATGQG
jgi:riboflavin synthase